jgi:hypothetical protein
MYRVRYSPREWLIIPVASRSALIRLAEWHFPATNRRPGTCCAGRNRPIGASFFRPYLC